MMKDSIDRYLDIINDLNGVSDEELNKILIDSELKEIHDTFSKTIGALVEIPEIDIDYEWEQFSEKHNYKRHNNIIKVLSNFLTRNAAAVILVTIASLAVVATTISIHYSFDSQSKSQQPSHLTAKISKQSTLISKDSAHIAKPQVQTPETIVFKNQPLEQIMTSISTYYGCTVNFKTDATKKLRLYFQWNQTQSLEETIEHLDSFEHLEMKLTDNTITVE